MALTSPTNAGSGGLVVTGTPTSGQAPLSDGAGGVAWGTVGGGVPRVLLPSDITTILATSANTHFARVPYAPHVLRLIAPTTFATVANALSTPMRGWTAPAGGATSAAVSGGVLTIIGNSTGTPPYFTRSFVRGTRRMYLEGRVGVTSGWAIFNTVAFGCGDFDLYNTSGGSGPYQARVFNTATGTIGTATTFTAGEMTSKVWFRFIYDDGQLTILYNKANVQSTPPTGWIQIGRYDMAQPGSGTWTQYIGPGASTYQTVTIEGLRMWSDADSNQNGQAPPDLNCESFPTTSDVLTLAVLDYGTGKGLPDIANLKLRLAAAVNPTPGDTAAWTFSMTGSDSESPAAATTYQEAPSLTLKQPGTNTTETVARQYWTLRAICTSAGSVLPGSIDISELAITTAAA